MSTRLLGHACALQLFHGLSDESHLAVLAMLRDGERCVCGLQEALGTAQSRQSFLLKVLRDAGLVHDRKAGRWSTYRLNRKPFDDIHACVQDLTTNPGVSMATQPPDVSTLVRAKYGEAARRVLGAAEPAAASCCPPVNSCCGGMAFNGTVDPITSNLYVNGETSELPGAAVLASLGCGNPTALTELHEGEVVLDLGSGGGIDVLLSARRVGASGKAYGLDMTDEMLALARRNAAEAGVTNVEFLQGRIEEIPLPDNSVDVIISNCVINLSGDKGRVLAEAFRVLKPGGRFAVSDVVVRGDVPPAVRRSMELWVGCVAGALDESEFRTLLAVSGFKDIAVEPTRIYRSADARQFLESSGIDVDAHLDAIDGRFMAAFVRATKPEIGNG